MGAAYGTAKSGVGVASMGVMRPELVMKSIVPVVMAGVLGIYGLIIAVIISTGINPKAKSYYLFDGYAHLSSGLACGLAGLSAGMAIGIVGDAGVSLISEVGKTKIDECTIINFSLCILANGLGQTLIKHWPPCQPRRKSSRHILLGSDPDRGKEHYLDPPLKDLKSTSADKLTACSSHEKHNSVWF
ncbi:hypothetical protein BHM03_00034977 [Ensete ventricosum]|nr:hypothetical protein BHM03_00034977 [Ensete ventricosum]